MKRSRKTLFALLLALVMALGLTATAWAAEGNVTVNLPDGFIEQTPNVPMDPSDPVYKIHFTKVVEQGVHVPPARKPSNLKRSMTLLMLLNIRMFSAVSRLRQMAQVPIRAR